MSRPTMPNEKSPVAGFEFPPIKRVTRIPFFTPLIKSFLDSLPLSKMTLAGDEDVGLTFIFFA